MGVNLICFSGTKVTSERDMGLATLLNAINGHSVRLTPHGRFFDHSQLWCILSVKVPPWRTNALFLAASP